MFGGYQARKHDPEPGAQIMWRGQERLSAATIAYEVKAIVDAQDALSCAKKWLKGSTSPTAASGPGTSIHSAQGARE